MRLGLDLSLTSNRAVTLEQVFNSQPELISNGDPPFSALTGTPSNTPPTGWTAANANALYSVQGGNWRIDRNGGAGQNTTFSVTTTSGLRYALLVNVVDGDVENALGTDNVLISAGAASETSDALGDRWLLFTAGAPSTTIGFRPASGTGQVIDLGYVRCRHVPGF